MQRKVFRDVQPMLDIEASVWATEEDMAHALMLKKASPPSALIYVKLERGACFGMLEGSWIS